MQTAKNKTSYFITTPIFYVNSVPHVGHLYTALMADAAARWQRMKQQSKSVLFATGTDEHGIKVQKRAQQENKKPLAFCDEISSKFRHLFDACDIKYDDFIRTSETRHRSAVLEFWSLLVKRGFIYKSTYEGWYSANDECFYGLKEVVLICF